MNTKHIFNLVLAGLVIGLLLTLAPQTQAADANWYAQYWNNVELRGTPVLVREEQEINYNWGERAPAGPGVNLDNFSVRWTRTVYFGQSTTYRFSATMDDGMRVWVDDVLLIDAWTTGMDRTITADRYLTAGDHRIKVEYFDAILGAQAKFSWQVSPNPAPPPTPITYWRGEYYNNKDLVGAPAVVRDDANIEFNWGVGSPVAGVASDFFSVRWTRTLNFESGRYRFTTTSDDGVRLWVNNQLIIDRWFQQAAKTYTAEIDLSGNVPVRLEYFDHTYLAQVQLSWTKVSGTPGSGTGGQPVATVASARMNVRTGPSTSFPVITTLTQGTVVQLAGYRNANTTWVMIVLANGTQGWSYAPLLQSSYPFSSLAVWSDDDPGSGGGAMGTITGVYWLNVRQGPGVTFSVITTVQGGSAVQLIGRNANNTWFKVMLANGTQGWVRSTYVTTDYPVGNLPVLTG